MAKDKAQSKIQNELITLTFKVKVTLPEGSDVRPETVATVILGERNSMPPIKAALGGYSLEQVGNFEVVPPKKTRTPKE